MALEAFEALVVVPRPLEAAEAVPWAVHQWKREAFLQAEAVDFVEDKNHFVAAAELAVAFQRWHPMEGQMMEVLALVHRWTVADPASFSHCCSSLEDLEVH